MLPQFIEDLLVVDLDVDAIYRKRLLDPAAGQTRAALPEVAGQRGAGPAGAVPGEVGWLRCGTTPPRSTDALVLGPATTRRRTASRDVVLGLSGGIDSLAGRRHRGRRARARARPRRVDAVAVFERRLRSRTPKPSPRPSACDYRTIAIEPAFAAFLDLLAPSFAGREPDLTEENLQSRVRGMLLMALSNKFGWLVLTTGNKSEMAVGYSTLYGDSAGGFAVIKDVYKTTVYELCRYVNDTAGQEIIPEAVFVKPPSAELRPDQRDDQSLPPYEVLDPILKAYVEDDRTTAEIIAMVGDEAERAAHHPPGRRGRVQAAPEPRRASA